LLLFSLGARAALGFCLILRAESDFVRDFEQSGHVLGDCTVLLNMAGRGDLYSRNHVVELMAGAALRSRVAAGRSWSLVADEVAFGLGASRGLAARPRALGSRASRSAVGNGGSADGLALGGQADVLAERAARGLAVLPRAAHLTLRLLAADVAGSLAELLAAELASRLLALRLTDGGAGWSVTRPLAVGKARALGCQANLLEAGSIGEGHILRSRCSDKQ